MEIFSIFLKFQAKIKKPDTLSQNASVKTLRSEENKENLIKEHEKTKSIIIIDDKKPMDNISMRQFSKPYPQAISSSAGLKKKNASVHQLNSYDSSAKNDENVGLMSFSFKLILIFRSFGNFSWGEQMGGLFQ